MGSICSCQRYGFHLLGNDVSTTWNSYRLLNVVWFDCWFNESRIVTTQIYMVLIHSHLPLLFIMSMAGQRYKTEIMYMSNKHHKPWPFLHPGTRYAGNLCWCNRCPNILLMTSLLGFRHAYSIIYRLVLDPAKRRKAMQRKKNGLL